MIQAAPRSQSGNAGPVEVCTQPLPGPFSVGVCDFHLVDPAREDTQDRGPRQFMLSAFYPANASGEKVRARFVDMFEPAIPKALAYLTRGLETNAKNELLSKLHSSGIQSFRDALPDRSAAPCPVLIYYPAGGGNRLNNVEVCEGLASHGFVVLCVDGPHDAALVVFPDGHLSKGPLKGDYISPGVGDVGYLLGQLDELNRSGFLAGLMDTNQVGLFGHSRGGYISTIAAFLNEQVKAAVSIDCFLWGYATDGSGLEKHLADFQAKVKSTPKPILRLGGRPGDSDPEAEAASCLARDGGDFVGAFSFVAFPGWAHGDFATTPWTCGKGPDLIKNQSRENIGAAEPLTAILKSFFEIHLRGANADELSKCLKKFPELGLATRGAV